MAAVSTELWIKFFTRAGIPQRAAATYALTFADNRIQLDMLLDLNKEYLRDMGITLMGDVIAILRHARQVHEELTHEKLLFSAKSSSSSVKPVTNVRENANNSVLPKVLRSNNKVKASPKSSSSSSDDSSSSSQSSSPPSPPKKVTVSSRISDPNPKLPAVGRTGTISSGALSHTHSSCTEKNIAKKTEPQTDSFKRRSGEISRSKPSGEKLDIEETPIPVKKARRVLPEHEGGYKIKMPSGSTPRSQEILAKQKEIAMKKTVFDRLGRSSSPGVDPLTAAVSSTTSDPSFTVTGLDNSKKTSSVFRRLGDKQVSSTSAAQATEENRPFSGILKNTVIKPVSRPHCTTQRTSSMVADSLSRSSRIDVQSRIGTQKEVAVVKSSASFVSLPNAEVTVKRTASVVSLPKQVSVVKRTATIVPVSKPAKVVNTEGILAGNSGNACRSVKSRLGADDVPKTSSINHLKQRLRSTAPVKQRIDSEVNGTHLSSSSKKVTFSTTAEKVLPRSGVFGRLGR